MGPFDVWRRSLSVMVVWLLDLLNLPASVLAGEHTAILNSHANTFVVPFIASADPRTCLRQLTTRTNCCQTRRSAANTTPAGSVIRAGWTCKRVGVDGSGGVPMSRARNAIAHSAYSRLRRQLHQP